MFEGPFEQVGGGALLVGVTYAVPRRRLANVAPVVFGSVPSRVGVLVPDRYRE